MVTALVLVSDLMMRMMAIVILWIIVIIVSPGFCLQPSMPLEGPGGFLAVWSDDSVPSPSAAIDDAMVMLSFLSDDSVPSSRATFDLSALEDLRVAPLVTAAAMLLVDLPALWRTGLAPAGGVG